MRKLLNTLFVLNPDTYLSLDNNAVLVQQDDKKLQRIPLLQLEQIYYFGYKGASPALMGYCASNNIRLSFITPKGKFLCAVSGENNGNVLLRKEQYRISDDEKSAVIIARNFIIGKIYNARRVLLKAARDHSLRIDIDKVTNINNILSTYIRSARTSENLAELRGIEGVAAEQYFSCFDELVLQQKDDFRFLVRSRRPPLNRTNALLSFAYVMLANECAAGLSAVGLDPYVGFMHTDRPGRMSLALDLMEELRSVIADRLVLSLINTKAVLPHMFEIKENGSCFMNDEGKKAFFTAWQKKKQETIKHPFLGEKIEWGLIPYVQALLLARYIRGDLDEYPPFFWN